MNSTLYRTLIAATALSSILSANAQAQQTTTGADQQAQALLERIEKLETELGDLRAKVLESSLTATKAETTALNAVDRIAGVENQTDLIADNTRPSEAPDTKWHLAGYADVGFSGGDMPGSDSFLSGKLNPAFHFQYKDLLVFESEFEYSTTNDGETTSELEYSQIDLILNDYAVLIAGKYLSPIGQFQERLHPSWINKVQGAPAGFGHDGVQPSSDTGLQLRGSIPAGATRFTYAVAVGNGPRTTSEGGVALKGTGADDNGDKSVGGRIGFFPLRYLEVGGSYLTAKVNGIGNDELVSVGPKDARYELWGVDAAYTKGPIAARFEYLNSQRGTLLSVTDDDPLGLLLPRLKMEAWYGQLSYRLSDVTDSDMIHRLEPVIRYGEFDISGHPVLAEENAQNRLNIGLNYWLAPTIVTKAGLEWRDYKVPGVPSETRVQFQLGYGF